MEKVRIDYVEEKVGGSGKPYWLVTHSGDKKASIAPFHKSLADFLSNHLGDMVEIEITRNGDYMNITNAEGWNEDDIQPAGKFAAAPRKSGGFSGGKADPKKLVSIERQATAKMVMAYYGAIGKELNQENFTKVANFVYDWVHDE